jgi:hypothetical protein
MANNLFLDAKELLLQNDQLNYINYESISEEHKEFLRSDTWDFVFTKVISQLIQLCGLSDVYDLKD